MNKLGGLNKSANGAVIGVVQLQWPVIRMPEDIARQTDVIAARITDGTSWGFAKPVRMYKLTNREAAE